VTASTIFFFYDMILLQEMAMVFTKRYYELLHLEAITSCRLVNVLNKNAPYIIAQKTQIRMAECTISTDQVSDLPMDQS
jgi:hypothetical protein